MSNDKQAEISRAKSAAEEAAIADFRRTHSADGYPLGSVPYPDNREGRRALARTWKRQRS